MIDIRAPAKYLEDAAGFFLRELLPRVRVMNIDIVYRDFYEMGVLGFCCQNDIRDYEIQLCRTTHEDREGKLLTLAHEMVHVKQYYRRELVHTRRYNQVIFEGTLYDWTHDIKFEPWETEPNESERYLVDLYVKRRKV